MFTGLTVSLKRLRQVPPFWRIVPGHRDSNQCIAPIAEIGVLFVPQPPDHSTGPSGTVRRFCVHRDQVSYDLKANEAGTKVTLSLVDSSQDIGYREGAETL
jgi:hypothetical protein